MTPNNPAMIAAMAQATRSCGAVVRLKPEEFMRVLARAKDPLIVTASAGIFKTHYDYLFSYKGLTFYTQAGEPLDLPPVDVVEAESIYVPG
jgi:hypothetical protein